jgi:hypothetical protein
MKKLVHGFSVDTQMNLNPQQQNESKAAATKQSPRNNLTITKKNHYYKAYISGKTTSVSIPFAWGCFLTLKILTRTTTTCAITIVHRSDLRLFDGNSLETISFFLYCK